MSNVHLLEDARTSYISCAYKFVVDLSSTKMDICVETPSGVVQPAPSCSVAGSASLDGNQFFDVTALILKVDDIREHANNRSSFVVRIFDGSRDEETNKVKVMPLTIYFDAERLDDKMGLWVAGMGLIAEFK